MNSVTNLNRRSMLKVTGLLGGGFLIGQLGASRALAEEAVQDLVVTGELNAFIRVTSEGQITIYSANPEMGQGIKTALPMIIAEELGAAWEDVEVLQSPVDESTFGRQGAGGSTSIPRNFDAMREMGASAREMFIGAGSLVMEVPREELDTADSQVVHTSGRYMTFGQLASLAAKQEVPNPGSLAFRQREDYRIIGTSVSGVDNLSIATGLALFGIDTRVDEMLYAAYEKCPAIGGKVVSANLNEVKKLPGVVDAFLVEGNGKVEELLDGVAIVGTSTWAVFNAKKALEVRWDESDASKDSWTKLVADARALEGTRGKKLTLEKGDVDAVFADQGARTFEAFYDYAFVTHLCLEPMNCTAHYRHGKNGAPDSLELWIPTQFPSGNISTASAMFNVDETNITAHQMRLGGSFGRRVYSEYVCEATAISKRVRAPVKLTWTREDDIHHDFFRVGGFQNVKAAVDDNGSLVGFEHHFIGMSHDGRPTMGSWFRKTEFPMENIENAYATSTLMEIDTPCGPWRAPGSNVNAFVIQSFLNEVAVGAGRDYVEFLLEILGEPRWFEEGNIRSLNTGRAADVIKLAAEKGSWGKQMPAGSGQGFSFYFCHAAHVAELAEVRVTPDKQIIVDRVTVAIDVGPIINMSGALSQVEGSVIDGLSTMLGQKITMEAGRIEQSNFDDYPVLRMPQSPIVDIHFIQSEYDPTGLGEPALPPLAPAVGNAVYAATGERVRSLPFSGAGFKG
jgi:isoquinoline 1-oxidoreductase beta subunit